jgi:chromosome partitioning protein
MTKTIAFINQKGGTGKTTSTVNIGAGLSRLGKKVLVIDLDPQANLTYHLGIKAGELKASISELLEGRTGLEEATIKGDGLDVIPSTLGLAETEARIFNVTGREHLLKGTLARLKPGYAYVLIDCPPSLGTLTINALVASREVYIPLEVQALALQGLRAIKDIVDIARERLNPGLEITGIIATKFDGRKNLNKEVLETIKKHFGPLLFRTVIRDTVRLAEAPSYGRDIFTYAPRSYGAEDYLNLCKEILQRSKRL